MKITVDTNILVRAVVRDDPVQTPIAVRLLEEAELIAVTMATLCEFVWVLTRSYRRRHADIATAIRQLLAVEKVNIDRFAAEAGLAVLQAGGDFADGVIAFTGRQLGGAVFASFDRRAVQAVASVGGASLWPEQPRE